MLGFTGFLHRKNIYLHFSDSLQSRRLSEPVRQQQDMAFPEDIKTRLQEFLEQHNLSFSLKPKLCGELGHHRPALVWLRKAGSWFSHDCICHLNCSCSRPGTITETTTNRQASTSNV